MSALPQPGGRWAAALAAWVVLLATPSAGAQEVKLPLGETNGVHIERNEGALTLTFSAPAAKLYRRVAGKRVSVSCTKLSASALRTGPGFSMRGTKTVEVRRRAPKRRGPITAGSQPLDADYCRVWLTAHTVKRDGKREKRDRELLVSVPLTQVGAVRLDEEDKSRLIYILLMVAGNKAEGAKPQAYPSLYRLLPARSRRLLRVVALKRPSDTPPAGRAGYYTDRRQHLVLVAVSALGRRLFYEAQGKYELRTNINGLFGDLE